jgi:tripartite-type tricarboxylate transporter receptor subunit TctC
MAARPLRERIVGKEGLAMKPLLCAVALSLGCTVAGPALAQGSNNFPEQPIRILVGFTPGVAPDITGRLLAEKFTETWGKPAVVENVTGAGGNLAVERLARAAPDGHTLALGGNAALVINPNFPAKLGYDPLKDFAYITQIFIVANILVVRPEVPANNIAELVALAKARPDYLVAGHAGSGTSQHLAGELFKIMAGVNIQQVPYRGTTAILPDLLGGRLNMFFGNITNLVPLIREGKLRAFGITSLKRSPLVPDLPTMEELGFPGFNATAWFGLMAPAGTPQPTLDKLYKETLRVLALPDVKGKLEGLGVQLVGSTPAEFASVVRTELPAWGKVIKEAGIKVGE